MVKEELSPEKIIIDITISNSELEQLHSMQFKTNSASIIIPATVCNKQVDVLTFG